ncbi:lipopolysaccharide/colanic/teichoic acid biosynthesis glycosyltransferase [Flavobacterium sp. CG_23.5]|uniref:sugar transferase n=1 Tax=unclassified Flavobacterium TaxID=196869 RepID=UPI0018C911AC|nr:MULTISPECIES: sugar transferase [unclassified Flavobacterium]MBG6109848.1 lipopolysaccharide/colanic/teichoic acid biosynthesis glycosyltransferase [Flavobacterium sp. CG_9.10]MBP2283090.1 lipopolysaccharide/colanic/teichoic acid biosynthesis glycosyltransferase [Flavobacterium sp. CG_23.5]
MTKRIFDILFSLIILLLFFWVLIIAWLLAIIDTHTNGIFLQVRIGQYGAKFKIYKLRTIQVDLASEKRTISSIGKLLRRYKLDELPQLLNVLKGEMSIVGPRPDLPGYYDVLEGENRKILELKPGLTSPAALKYSQEQHFLEQQENPLISNDTIIFPDKVKLNLAYYYNRSFWGDLMIILKTVEFIVFGSR